MALSTIPNNMQAPLAAANMPAGSVLQVIQNVKQNQSSTTSASYSDIGLYASITPSSSSNKIMVILDIMWSHAPGYSGSALRLLRDSTTIYYGTGTGYDGFAGAYITTQDYVCDRVVANYLDSPSSTSSLTYKVQYSGLQSHYVGINRSQRVNGTFDPRGASSITVMEIAG
tara:strand:- start:125 stop:637 length:513 start_codon:yes stop_codon:yes gene_type:complete